MLTHVQARPHEIAAQWATILTDEFARQAAMEDDLGIPSALFAPPIRDNIVELGKSQIGFMGIFALPLFRGVSQIMPAMKFSVNEMEINKSIWETKIDQGQNAERRGTQDRPDPDSPLDSFRLTGNHSRIPTVPLSSELHPPETKPHSGQISPRTSRTPTKEISEHSRRSSLGTGISQAHHTPGSNKNHIGHSLFPETTNNTSSRRSSTNTTLRNGQAPSVATEVPSTPAADRSSDAFSGSYSSSSGSSSPHAVALPLRRSSTTTSGQLQHESNGGAVSSNNPRRRSADHSLVAVLVTSSGQTTTSSSKTGSDSPSPSPRRHHHQLNSHHNNNHHHHNRHDNNTRRHSSGKSSLPSSPHWASPVTGNDDPHAKPPGKRSSSLHSPTTTDYDDDTDNDGTLSRSTHEGDHKYRYAPPPPPPPPIDRDLADHYTTSSTASSMRERSVRHKTSRWKLKFWAGKRKVSNEQSPAIDR